MKKYETKKILYAEIIIFILIIILGYAVFYINHKRSRLVGTYNVENENVESPDKKEYLIFKSDNTYVIYYSSESVVETGTYDEDEEYVLLNNTEYSYYVIHLNDKIYFTEKNNKKTYQKCAPISFYTNVDVP